MSDSDIFEIDEDDSKVFIPKTKNKANKNKKEAMTPERKQALLEQLARGRATSAINRAKNAKVKKIKKQDQITEQDEMIYKDIEKKRKKKEQEPPLKTIDEDNVVMDFPQTDEQIDEQIKKLQSRKKPVVVAPVSAPVVSAPVSAPVTIPKPRKLQPWELSHLW
jgi:hypothetical protein